MSWSRFVGVSGDFVVVPAKTEETAECDRPDCTDGDCPTHSKPLLEEAPTLDVPDSRQSEGWSCGAVCVTSVAQFFGVEPDTEGEAIQALGSSPSDGTDPEHIVAVLTAAGLETTALSGMDLDQLEYFLGNGRPVICCIQAWGTPDELAAVESGHYVVCCGIDAEAVTVMDPARFEPGEEQGEYQEQATGQKVRIPRDVFLRRWVDVDAEGNTYQRYGVAVWMSGVTEAAGTCKRGERSDLTGCVPASGDFATDKSKEEVPDDQGNLVMKPYDPSMTGEKQLEWFEKVDKHIAAGGDIPDEVFDTFPQYVQNTFWQDLKKNREKSEVPPKSKYGELPEVDWSDNDPGYVYRIQPIGASLHGKASETSAGNTIKGVFVFDNLNELAAIDWANEKNIELVKIKAGSPDLFHVGDQEGVGLKKRKGKVVARTGFADVRAAKEWAIQNQKRNVAG